MPRFPVPVGLQPYRRVPVRGFVVKERRQYSSFPPLVLQNPGTQTVLYVDILVTAHVREVWRVRLNLELRDRIRRGTVPVDPLPVELAIAIAIEIGNRFAVSVCVVNLKPVPCVKNRNPVVVSLRRLAIEPDDVREQEKHTVGVIRVLRIGDLPREPGLPVNRMS